MFIRTGPPYVRDDVLPVSCEEMANPISYFFRDAAAVRASWKIPVHFVDVI